MVTALVREVADVSGDMSRHDVLASFSISTTPRFASADLLLLRDGRGNGGLLVLLAQEIPDDLSPAVERYDVRLRAGRFAGIAARVFSVRLRPSALEEMVVAFQNLTMRVATGQRGFRGGLLLVDAERDRVLSIGIWEDMARLEASAASGYLADQVSAHLPYFHQTPTERRMHVIHLHDESQFQQP